MAKVENPLATRGFLLKDIFVWCGWETPYAKWGAIWKYRQDIYYDTFNNSISDFVVPWSTTMNVNAFYKFMILPGSAPLPAVVGQATRTSQGNNTIYSVYPVTENPLILKFQ